MRRVLVVLALSIGALAHAADELALPAVTRTTLANGLRVVVAEYHELPVVSFVAFVGAGAAQDPPGKEGLAMLTAATLKRGTSRMSAEALAEAIESVGGVLGAAAGTDATVATAEFLAPDFELGLEFLRQVLREPAFDRDEVRRAREEQLAALVAGLEEPSIVAERCFAPFLYGRHPYGLPADGRRESVSTLGRGDVRAFHDRWYRPNNTILVVVGDVRADAAVGRIEAALGDWQSHADAVPPRAAAPEPVAARRVLLVDKPDATQTQIRVGAIGMARRDPELLPSQVANTILGGGFTSRLIEELRVKRSLTYGASSTFLARRAGGDFRIHTFTKTPTTVETLSLALDVLSDFRDRPLDATLVAKAKTYMRGQYPLRLETPEAIAMRLAEIEFNDLPQDELQTYRTRVGAVTAEVAGRAARAHMPARDAVAITVVGKASEIRAPLEAAFGPLTVVTPAQCDGLAKHPAAP